MTRLTGWFPRILTMANNSPWGSGSGGSGGSCDSGPGDAGSTGGGPVSSKGRCPGAAIVCSLPIRPKPRCPLRLIDTRDPKEAHAQIKEEKASTPRNQHAESGTITN